MTMSLPLGKGPLYSPKFGSLGVKDCPLGAVKISVKILTGTIWVSTHKKVENDQMSTALEYPRLSLSEMI